MTTTEPLAREGWEQIEERASTFVRGCDTQSLLADRDGSLFPITDAERFARFILRALPVLRWAEKWRDETCSRMPDCDPYEGTHDAHCEITRNEREGLDAVDAFRSGR